MADGLDPMVLMRRNPVFAGSRPAVLRPLADASVVRFYDDGAPVVRLGSDQTEVLLIAQGAVRLFRRDRARGSQMLIGLLRAPALFGDAELYARRPWSVSGCAICATTVVAMPNAAFDRAVSSDHGLAAGLYREACARHFLVIQILQILGLQPALQRVLALLWEESKSIGEATGERVVHLAPVRLSKALGVDRKTIFRNLRELEQRGLLRRESGQAVLLLPPDFSCFVDLGSHGFGATWRTND